VNLELTEQRNGTSPDEERRTERQNLKEASAARDAVYALAKRLGIETKYLEDIRVSVGNFKLPTWNDGGLYLKVESVSLIPCSPWNDANSGSLPTGNGQPR
jgi:hypothetical protein